MRLLEKHRDRTRPPRRSRDIALILGLIIAFLVGLALFLVVLAVALVIWLIGQRT